MNWIVPHVLEWRELPSESTGRRTLHDVRGPLDSCMHCGQDLRIPMLAVNAITHEDRWRYEVCYDAFLAHDERDRDAISECNEYGVSVDDQEKLARLFSQGWRIALDGSCGPEEITFVGVTDGGICLFAVEGEYEVRNQIQVRYEEAK